MMVALLLILPCAYGWGGSGLLGDYHHAGKHLGGGQGWGNGGEAVVRHPEGKYSQDCPAGYYWNSYRRRCVRVGNTSGLTRINYGREAPRMGREERECEPGYEWHYYRQRCDRTFRNGNAGQPLYPRDQVGENSKKCPTGYAWNSYRRRCVNQRG